MIHYIQGNLFDSKAQALVNTVNTHGVMGKGIALQFKKLFPQNFKLYSQACKSENIGIGKLFVTKDQNIQTGEKIIVNFPTKKDWRNPSEYSYIEKGLDDLLIKIESYQIQSIAIPPLGAGNGGLDWEKVKQIIENKLKGLDIEVWVYEPSGAINEKLEHKRVKLTDARALLLFVLFDLVRNGEYVSEFSSEKVCYFLQKFGGQKYFKLQFEPNFYGPYSGKVRYVLNVMNGSYLMGYSDMNKKPFQPLTLLPEAYDEVKSYVESKPELLKIANQTIEFLRGFYSDFGLELLSSVDYLVRTTNSNNSKEIINYLEGWNDRKRSMFSNPKYINISLQRIMEVAVN
jgi:O-acetyl-ADP-ribose deacetylase (regulator of RNase III)/uncharacterized protein YwgA